MFIKFCILGRKKLIEYWALFMPTLLDSSLSIFGMKLNNNSLNFSGILTSNNSITPTAVHSLNNLTQQILSSTAAANNQNLSDGLTTDTNNFLGGILFYF